jgi:hypothetical protein
MTRRGGVESPEPPGGFFPAVHDKLKRLAAARLAGERAGHSLDATALVHEAYLRLGEASFDDRSGFFRAAAVIPANRRAEFATGVIEWAMKDSGTWIEPRPRRGRRRTRPKEL